MPACPRLSAERFPQLAGKSEVQVEKDWGRFVSELHTFLNSSAVTRFLQSRRSAWRAPRESQAFTNFKAEPEHWYTFNHGGRSEAQLNIGMFPDRLRIGLGFEFTEKEHGDPKHVRLAFVNLLSAIDAKLDTFGIQLSELSAELELVPNRGGPLKVLQGSQVLNTLLDLPHEPRWLFIGRMIRPTRDATILSSGDLLGAEIERVFSLVMPWWEKANLGTN